MNLPRSSVQHALPSGTSRSYYSRRPWGPSPRGFLRALLSGSNPLSARRPQEPNRVAPSPALIFICAATVYAAFPRCNFEGAAHSTSAPTRRPGAHTAAAAAATTTARGVCVVCTPQPLVLRARVCVRVRCAHTACNRAQRRRRPAKSV